MEELADSLNYVYSCSLHDKIRVKVSSLEGLKRKYDCNKLLEDEMVSRWYLDCEIASLMVSVEVFSRRHPLCAPMTTSYKSFESSWNWNEWITLPLKFSDLPRDALLTFTMYECAGDNKVKVVGGTTVEVFGKHGELIQGLLDLYVWPDVCADALENTTPGLFKSSKNRIQSFCRLMKKHRQNEILKVDWLDKLSFREMELICDSEKKTSNEIYLTIELPEFYLEQMPILVIYFEEESIYQFNPFKEINLINDPEVFFDNDLVEDKHHKLSRSVRSRASDRDTKPNSQARDLLIQIVRYPPMKSLTAEEQDILWKYRFYLSDQKKALVKFLKCVNWSIGLEVHQALDMIVKWAPIDTDDALQLLTPEFSHPTVRQYAIDCLKQASDETLLLYCLQLVQALRYENRENIMSVYNEMQMVITNNDSNVRNVIFLRELLNKCDDFCTYLLSLLISRACHNFKIANYFFWYLTSECTDSGFSPDSDKVSEMYLKVLTLFMQALRYGDSELQRRYILLQNQQNLLNCLVELIKLVAKEAGNRTKKTMKLQQLLSDPTTFKMQFLTFDPIPLPLDPDVIVKGIVPEKAFLFKSNLMPSHLTFLTTENTEYVALFKNGDDLRQDQLVLQVITLIDNLLLSENLDLKLTPYKVLATSTSHGFVQYIPSRSIADILSKEGSILTYFKNNYHPTNVNSLDFPSEIMDTYIKSCAGYSVITYLLGVGDRHLDNLLITPNGNLFHIDFGFILGRDPKPLPPPMKLSKEMVEAMGGLSSDNYAEFKKLCFTAFLILRRHADLILNLFSLMTDANIPDIALEPDKAVKKIEAKLCLELGDEEAVQHFKTLLDSSVADVMAALVDQLHKLTQYYRN